MTEEKKEQIFWLDGWKGKAKGGVYWWAFDLIKFMNKVEKKLGKVVAIKFDGSNNAELIYEVK